MSLRDVYQARNRVIARLYREHGWTMENIADELGMSIGNVHRILKNLDALLSDREKRKRNKAAMRLLASQPEYREKMAKRLTEAWQEGKFANRKFSGRRAVYADEPAKRALYQQLRRKVGPIEARRMVEDQFSPERRAA